MVYWKFGFYRSLTWHWPIQKQFVFQCGSKQKYLDTIYKHGSSYIKLTKLLSYALVCADYGYEAQNICHVQKSIVKTLQKILS